MQDEGKEGGCLQLFGAEGRSLHFLEQGGRVLAAPQAQQGPLGTLEQVQGDVPARIQCSGRQGLPPLQLKLGRALTL